MSRQAERIKVMSAGISSFILMLGIARFAYTPMLPQMQEHAGLTVSGGGWLAAINYVGYLLGAIAASQISSLTLKFRLYQIGLVVAVISTVLMGMTDNFWLWSVSRFFAGLSAAAGILLASGLILNWLIRHEYRPELGIHFSGVGLSIAFCALAVELMRFSLGWSEQWLVLALLGAVILIPAWAWMPAPDPQALHTSSGRKMVDSPPGPLFMKIFMLAYFCAGVGYVVTITFIVAIVDHLPGLEGKGIWTFVILGLAAAPAVILWDLLARRIGDLNALFVAFCLQVVSIILPVFVQSLVPTLIGAALFGASFLGIVSLVLTMAGRYYPTLPAKMMGKMTISYGIGQILGPAIAGQLAQSSGNYNSGLYLAAGTMVFGTLLIMKLISMERAGE
jgi:predicted MFS family arabinose efflux permease